LTIIEVGRIVAEGVKKWEIVVNKEKKSPAPRRSASAFEAASGGGSDGK
jgi:hypothetical protein